MVKNSATEAARPPPQPVRQTSQDGRKNKKNKKDLNKKSKEGSDMDAFYMESQVRNLKYFVS